jgi:3-deoxy-manno-octulosonate cytidylyltransferase (CMP-KDO synthetase)
LQEFKKFNMSQFIGVIPARFASTRLPGKPLVDINGKSMIQRVYEQALKANLQAVYVATDHEQIYEHVKSFRGNCLMTSASHQSGTDRCNECAIQLNLNAQDVVINIQGDEPFIQPEQINLLAVCFENKSTEIATLIKRITSLQDLESSSIPKVVLNKQNEAIYFSRSVIPFPVKNSKEELIKAGIYFKHIGIYAYRVNTLKEISSLTVSLLEQTESLEQLRWIENGYKIKTAITTQETIAIDTAEDLEKAILLLTRL